MKVPYPIFIHGALFFFNICLLLCSFCSVRQALTGTHRHARVNHRSRFGFEFEFDVAMLRACRHIILRSTLSALYHVSVVFF